MAINTTNLIGKSETQYPPLVNRSELSEFLRISEKSLRNYESRGLIPVIKIGRRRLYRTASVLKSLEKLEVGG